MAEINDKELEQVSGGIWFKPVDGQMLSDKGAAMSQTDNVENVAWNPGMFTSTENDTVLSSDGFVL